MGWKLLFADSGTGRTHICTCNVIQMQRSSCSCGWERKEWILCISWFLSSLIYAAIRDAVSLLSHCIHNSMSPCKEPLVFKKKTLLHFNHFQAFSKQTLSTLYVMTSFQTTHFSLSVHMCESIYSSGDINSFYNWNFTPNSILLSKTVFLKSEWDGWSN